MLSLVYFILGYIFYSAIFVAAGSPVTTEQEAQQITSYVSMLLIFPMIIAMPIMQNSNSVWIKVLSFIPLLTPTLMILRISVQMPAAWEILSTIALSCCFFHCYDVGSRENIPYSCFIVWKTPDSG